MLLDLLAQIKYVKRAKLNKLLIWITVTVKKELGFLIPKSSSGGVGRKGRFRGAQPLLLYPPPRSYQKIRSLCTSFQYNEKELKVNQIKTLQSSEAARFKIKFALRFTQGNREQRRRHSQLSQVLGANTSASKILVRLRINPNSREMDGIGFR